MRDILTITLNPALDVSTSVGSVTAGPKLRCDRPRTDPGGGGINVSRAISILGGQSRGVVALGGTVGDRIAGLLKDDGLPIVRFAAPGETRQSLAVTDQETGEQYRFVMPGPEWSADHANALVALLTDHVVPEMLVVLSGSLPPGVPDTTLARLCATVVQGGGDVIADLSGAPLAQLANDPSVRTYILRMDQHEAETLAGASLPERIDTARFAQDLVKKGAAELVIIARGADGSVLASKDSALHVSAADVPVNSKVGAGDSFVGAFSLALASGETLAHAMQRGAAAASAAVMTEATELCRRADVEALIDQCPITILEGCGFDRSSKKKPR